MGAVTTNIRPHLLMFAPALLAEHAGEGGNIHIGYNCVAGVAEEAEAVMKFPEHLVVPFFKPARERYRSRACHLVVWRRSSYVHP